MAVVGEVTCFDDKTWDGDLAEFGCPGIAVFSARKPQVPEPFADYAELVRKRSNLFQRQFYTIMLDEVASKTIYSLI